MITKRCRVGLVLLALILYCLLAAGCGTVKFVRVEQAMVPIPPKAVVHPMSIIDLMCLDEETQYRLLESIKNWRMEILQWRLTAEEYNNNVRKLNTESRKALME